MGKRSLINAKLLSCQGAVIDCIPEVATITTPFLGSFCHKKSMASSRITRTISHSLEYLSSVNNFSSVCVHTWTIPKPLTGSQPGTAENPTVPHPGLVPFVMSFKAHGFAYNVGLTKPTGFLPTARRSSLIRLMIEANIGVLAEVPPSKVKLPSLNTAILSPFAATSGYLS